MHCLFGSDHVGILVYAVMTGLNALTIGTYFTLVVDSYFSRDRVTNRFGLSIAQIFCIKALVLGLHIFYPPLW